MTPRRAADLVTGWVRCYTRRLPARVAQRRIDEISADLHEHIAHERARGTSERRIACSILSRMVRGLVADACWRNHIRPWKGDLRKSLAANLAAVPALADVGAAAMLYGGNDDAPGVVLIGLLLIVGAFVVGVRAVLRRGHGAGRP